MENFDADAVLKQLTDRGMKGNIRLRGDTKELYFTDPDGIRVQLQDVKYKGGTGPLGDRIRNDRGEEKTRLHRPARIASRRMGDDVRLPTTVAGPSTEDAADSIGRIES